MGQCGHECWHAVAYEQKILFHLQVNKETEIHNTETNLANQKYFLFKKS